MNTTDWALLAHIFCLLGHQRHDPQSVNRERTAHVAEEGKPFASWWGGSGRTDESHQMLDRSVTPRRHFQSHAWVVALFDAAVILLKSIVEVLVGPM